jgi:Metal binding domain of Ada
LEINLTPMEYEPIGDPLEAAFELVKRSLVSVDAIAEADTEILAELECTDRASFKKNRTRYYAELNRRCGMICVARIRSASLTLGNLVGGAWQLAGEPTLELMRSRVEESPSAPASDVGGAYVGSRHSRVFHFPGCRFAKQISDDNVVRFATSVDARRDGRRACKNCEPK